MPWDEDNALNKQGRLSASTSGRHQCSSIVWGVSGGRVCDEDKDESNKEDDKDNDCSSVAINS